MKTHFKVLVLAVALCATAGVAGAQNEDGPDDILPSPENPPTRQGTRGANFLQIGIGARANAMAGAVASNIEGPEAWYWNPAGAASIETFSVNASRQNLYAGLDIASNYAAIALPLLGGVGGVSFNSLNSGELERTTEGEPFGDPIVGETFEFTATAVSLNYARRLTDRLDLGAGVKFISEGLTDARTSWVAVDLGTQFRTGIYGLTIGASLQNIGPAAQVSGELIRRLINTDQAFPSNTSVEFDVLETDLPTLFRFSVGTDLYGRASSVLGSGNGMHSLIGELAFNDAIDTDVQMAGGLEYGFNNMAFLRVGKRLYNDDRATGNEGLYGLSGGLGLRLPIASRSFRFDYAYTSMGDLENVQVFSLEFGR